MKLCLATMATATHNFKWVKLTHILFNLRPNVGKFWCLNAKQILMYKDGPRIIMIIRFGISMYLGTIS